MQQHDGRPTPAFTQGLLPAREVQPAQGKIQAQLCLKVSRKARVEGVGGLQHGLIRA